MIVLNSAEDINWHNLSAIAYAHETVRISDSLLAAVDRGRVQLC